MQSALWNFTGLWAPVLYMHIIYITNINIKESIDHLSLLYFLYISWSHILYIYISMYGRQYFFKVNVCSAWPGALFVFHGWSMNVVCQVSPVWNPLWHRQKALYSSQSQTPLKYTSHYVVIVWLCSFATEGFSSQSLWCTYSLLSCATLSLLSPTLLPPPSLTGH